MNRLLIAFISLPFAACGVSADLPAYQQSVAELQEAVAAHQNESATAPDCAAEHRRYDELARPRLGQMTRMSGGMNGGMRSTCGSMQTELDRHASSACAGDAAANQAETTRHCEVMRGWIAKQQGCTDSTMGVRCP